VWNSVKAVVLIGFVGLAAIVTGGTAGGLFGIALLVFAGTLVVLRLRRERRGRRVNCG
jgi:hypothetical protein